MSEYLTLAVDAMSGDRPAQARIMAVQRFLENHTHTRVLLVGDKDVLEPATGALQRRFADRFALYHAGEVVAMDEPPRSALRNKKNSSMRVAIDLVKQDEAIACISAGNTGALMATARFVLRMAEGIDRPAILSTIPATSGHTLMLDLGANADCSSELLFQFAVMGTVVAREVHGIRRPAVGLLNIGEEEMKGTDVIRAAARRIASSGLNYIGFVEGDDIFSGHVDVVVTDGFTGNVSLKTMEGAAHMLGEIMRKEFQRNLFTRISGLLSRPVLRAVRHQLDPRRYNGASLVGLTRIVIKSHGAADDVAFENALETALVEVKKAVPEQISAEMLRAAAAADAATVPESRSASG